MKAKTSKLDPYAERLTEWLDTPERGGAGLTLIQTQAKLTELGVTVSLSRLSDWWSDRTSQRLESALLERITSGARQCQEVEDQFSKAAAPGLDVLIKLHRVLILKLSTEGNTDPEKLELVNRMMREVQKFARLEQLERQTQLEERKITLMEQKAAQADQAKEVAGSDLTSEEKAARMRQIFGMA